MEESGYGGRMKRLHLSISQELQQNRTQTSRCIGGHIGHSESIERVILSAISIHSIL